LVAVVNRHSGIGSLGGLEGGERWVVLPRFAAVSA